MSPADEFVGRLRAEAAEQSRLSLDGIWRVFLQWRPELATAVSKRAELARWIEQARETGAFKLPKGKRLYDRTASPPLPAWIAFPIERNETELFDHRAYPWHPVMAFVASLPRLGNADDALAINRFLVADRSPPRAPSKERSYEIFGDEKRLAAVLGGILGSGLTQEALNCFTPDFIPVHRGGALHSDRVLVVENEATFDSFCHWNSANPTWHTVVFGRGLEVWKAESFLRETWPVKTRFEYFGDFDQEGVCIAHRLANLLGRTGRHLRPLLLAYRFLSQQAPRPDAKEHATDWPMAVQWLGDGEIIALASTIFAANQRVAQEAFGARQLQGIKAGEI
jgi:hypothetical protein